MSTDLGMKNDLQKNRDAAEALQSLAAGNRLQTAGALLTKLDELQHGVSLDDAGGFLDNAGELTDRIKEYSKLSDTLRVFADAPEDMETNLLFVLRTDAMKLPKKEQEDVPLRRRKQAAL